MPEPAVHELLILGPPELVSITIGKKIQDITFLKGEGAAVE